MVAITLFALLIVEEGYASDLELTRKFSPILVLTEDTGDSWGDIRVTKPEPVEMVNAQSTDSKVRCILGFGLLTPVWGLNNRYEEVSDYTFSNLSPRYFRKLWIVSSPYSG